MFQPDVKLQKNLHYFKVTHWPSFCSLQGTVTTFYHGINHSSKIISHFYKVFNLRTPSWVLFPTTDMQTTAKAPLFPCTAEPRGWRTTSIPSATGSSFKEATGQNRTWHGRCERCPDHLKLEFQGPGWAGSPFVCSPKDGISGRIEFLSYTAKDNPEL